MPQMAPINWLTLYFLFITVFLMFIIINYFIFLYTPKMIKRKKITSKLNWKW
uniref:ATP synthase complex subunit 8 n=1 Tax=Sciobius sp. SCI01 TaxID=1205648 RepID=A0A0S2MPW1_9CUCU|nr:ATP synthase F0 subunit 8 [Sciobius sp. SCI01]